MTASLDSHPGLDGLRRFLALNHCHTTEVFVLEGPDSEGMTEVALEATAQWSRQPHGLPGVRYDLRSCGTEIQVALAGPVAESFRAMALCDPPFLILGGLEALAEDYALVKAMAAILAYRFDALLPTVLIIADWDAPFLSAMATLDTGVYHRLVSATRMVV